MITYFTQEERDAIQHLPRSTPYLIPSVSRTQFSIARHYGGTVYNGARYFYIPQTDELIRADVMKFIQARRRAAAKRPAPAETLPLALDP